MKDIASKVTYNNNDSIFHLNDISILFNLALFVLSQLFFIKEGRGFNTLDFGGMKDQILNVTK